MLIGRVVNVEGRVPEHDPPQQKSGTRHACHGALTHPDATFLFLASTMAGLRTASSLHLLALYDGVIC